VKLRGLGEGKVVAPGGKLEPGESARDAAVREVAEECGIKIDATSIDLVGELDYSFPFKPSLNQRSWAFVARGDWPEPVASEELTSTWVPLADLPLARMWDDAAYWLEDALSGRFVRASFTFCADLSCVVQSSDPRFGAIHPARSDGTRP
jgi:8-oxo-dGTP diphosphatase